MLSSLKSEEESLLVDFNKILSACKWVPISFKPADDPAKRSFVYFLLSTNGKYYIGATVDLDNRLRCHNGEIANGARRTHRAIAKGDMWSRVCFVSGFPTWRTALQFESRWQRLAAMERRKNRRVPSLECGIRALRGLFALNRASTSSFPYNEWCDRGGSYPSVTFESDYVHVCANTPILYTPYIPLSPHSPRLQEQQSEQSDEEDKMGLQTRDES